MAEAKINELKLDISELNELLKQAKRKKVLDVLSLETRKLETELVRLQESETAKAAQTSGQPTVQASSSQKKRYQIKVNGYGWDQSDKYVKIFVTLNNVQSLANENVYCKFTDRSMELHAEDLNGKDYILAINKLLEPIKVDDSHWKKKTDMVVVFLAKANANVKWSHVTEVEKKSEDQRNNRFKPSDSEKKDPQDSIMGLMKNMYETGDDEMKRMISKAWYEGQHKQKPDSVEL